LKEPGNISSQFSHTSHIRVPKNQYHLQSPTNGISGSPEKGDVSVPDSREQQKENYCGRHNGYVPEATTNFPKARSRSRICSIGEENTRRKEELKI
jgi:hypothetical protein